MAEKIKGSDIWKAIVDFVIICLLVTGAGAGGYFYGIHERLAPVTNVPPGTAGALPATAILPAPLPTASAASTTTAAATTEPSKPAEAQSCAVPKSKTKYWISSSGVDYTGYSITVKVNDTPVDNFFGPGKTVDITRYIKQGDNDVDFEAKALGEQYNRHPGDAKSILTVQLVSGPRIQDEFKKSDVILSYSRNSSQSEDDSAELRFTGK